MAPSLHRFAAMRNATAQGTCAGQWRRAMAQGEMGNAQGSRIGEHPESISPMRETDKHLSLQG